MPHVETRFYLEQYGNNDDVWIGKTLYRYVVAIVVIEFFYIFSNPIVMH